MPLVVLFDLFVVPQLTNTKQRSSMITFLISTPLIHFTFPLIITICKVHISLSHLIHNLLLHQLYVLYLKYRSELQYLHMPAAQYATNMNVIRISPSLKLANEASIIKANTTPLYFLLFFFFSRLRNGY